MENALSLAREVIGRLGLVLRYFASGAVFVIGLMCCLPAQVCEALNSGATPPNGAVPGAASPNVVAEVFGRDHWGIVAVAAVIAGITFHSIGRTLIFPFQYLFWGVLGLRSLLNDRSDCRRLPKCEGAKPGLLALDVARWLRRHGPNERLGGIQKELDRWNHTTHFLLDSAIALGVVAVLCSHYGGGRTYAAKIAAAVFGIVALVDSFRETRRERWLWAQTPREREDLTAPPQGEQSRRE